MARVFNFSAGPSALPESVLRQAADEMLDYQGCGHSVMEMSQLQDPFCTGRCFNTVCSNSSQFSQ